MADKLEIRNTNRLSLGDIFEVVYEDGERELFLIIQARHHTIKRRGALDVIKTMKLVSFYGDRAYALSNTINVHTHTPWGFGETQDEKLESSVFYAQDILYLLGDIHSPVKEINCVGAVWQVNRFYLEEKDNDQ